MAKVTRIPAEDPDDVRKRDRAGLDSDLKELGGTREDLQREEGEE